MNKELIFKSNEQSGSGGIKPDKIEIETKDGQVPVKVTIIPGEDGAPSEVVEVVKTPVTPQTPNSK